MSFTSLPAPKFAEWSDTFPGESHRPASAPPAQYMETSNRRSDKKRASWRRIVRAKMTQAMRDVVDRWYWRTYNWRR